MTNERYSRTKNNFVITSRDYTNPCSTAWSKKLLNLVCQPLLPAERNLSTTTAESLIEIRFLGFSLTGRPMRLADLKNSSPSSAILSSSRVPLYLVHKANSIFMSMRLINFKQL